MPLALLALLLAVGDTPAASPQVPDPQAQVEDRIPAGAPKDDYGLVAWCDGVLSGHMDLAERVQDVLPLDPVQQKVGKSYLAAYEKALSGSKEASTAVGRKHAAASHQIGWKNWERARKANKQLAADTYLAWQLPGVCEHAAIRLSGDKDLFRMSPTPEEIEAMGKEAPVTGTRAAAVAEADAAQPDPAAPPPEATPAADDELKIKMLPDAPPAPDTSDAKKAKKKARQDELQEQTMHPESPQ